MRFNIVKKKSFEGAEAVVADSYEALLARLEREPEFVTWPDIEVQVVLGGADECAFWNVDQRALGFHAIAALKSEDDDEFFEVNENHEIHLNVESGTQVVASIVATPSSDRDIEIDLASLLVTAPHELLHLREWLQAARGRTPLQVFDQDEGEIGVRRIQQGIEPSSGVAEDRVEKEARDIVWRMMPGFIEERALKVVEALRQSPVPAMG
ncbi:hypothetical protein ACVIGB_000781 [Bradyrhizobium sp. USDA 4341]